ncbi:MAG TPA: glutathione S-transferase [Polyangiaceae bacterium]|nr:glutathione S-transferase [Polyangiaceae bacterium]
MQPSRPLRLYRHPFSGHSHRAELCLSLLGLPYELVHVDLMAGEHKRPEFLAMNVFGQVPVLEDGDFTLADSNAILVYLGERYDEAARFWPRAPEARAAVQRWLSIAAGPLHAGPAAARLVRLLGAKLDYERALRIAQQLFGVLEAELDQRDYLVGASPTLADLALYAYVARAPEGGITLDPYPALRSWLERVEELPGFVPMLATRKD